MSNMPAGFPPIDVRAELRRALRVVRLAVARPDRRDPAHRVRGALPEHAAVVGAGRRQRREEQVGNTVEWRIVRTGRRHAYVEPRVARGVALVRKALELRAIAEAVFARAWNLPSAEGGLDRVCCSWRESQALELSTPRGQDGRVDAATGQGRQRQEWLRFAAGCARGHFEDAIRQESQNTFGRYSGAVVQRWESRRLTACPGVHQAGHIRARRCPREGAVATFREELARPACNRLELAQHRGAAFTVAGNAVEGALELVWVSGGFQHTRARARAHQAIRRGQVAWRLA